MLPTSMTSPVESSWEETTGSVHVASPRALRASASSGQRAKKISQQHRLGVSGLPSAETAARLAVAMYLYCLYSNTPHSTHRTIVSHRAVRGIATSSSA